jgi:MFS transporter, ACS family, hexuronate transporter
LTARGVTGSVGAPMSSPQLAPVLPAAAERPWRWVIIGLIFLGTVINYFDRLALPTIAPVLRREYHFTNVQYAWIANAFLVVYALSMFGWGAVFDRIGNRLGFALAVVVWSAAEIGTAAARGLAGFCGMRGLLGLGESGNWPGATRTIAAWFPARQRALGMGIANTGASLGPAIATPLIITLLDAFGWRGVFLVTGALGFVWLVLWLALYPRSEVAAAGGVGGGRAGRASLPKISDHRSEEVGPGGPPGRGVPDNDPRMRDEGVAPPTMLAGAHHPPIPWPVLLRRREVWGIIAARFFGDPIWWLYLNWMPLYLADARGFDLKQIKAFGWVPYFAAALGALAGGLCSGWLLRRGATVNRARKTAIVIGTVAMLAGFATAFAPTAPAALAWMSITLFGFQFWLGNVQTLPSDYFPVGAVGSIAGFSGTAAGLGAVLFTFSTGWVVDHFSYVPILLTAAVLAPLATASLFLLAGRVRTVEIETANLR